MSYDEIVQKQELAINLYKQANNQIEFNGVKNDMKSMLEVMQKLDEGPHMLMVDLNENKSLKEIIFIIFDSIKRIVVDTLHLEPVNKGKLFLQAINFHDRVFLVERAVSSDLKNSTVTVWEYHRSSTAADPSQKLTKVDKFKFPKSVRPIL